MDQNRLKCVRYSLILFNIAFLIFGSMIAFFSYFGLKSNENLFKVLYEFNPEIKTIRKCFTITGVLIIVNAVYGLTAIIRKRLSILIAFCFILIGLTIFTVFSLIMGSICYRNLNSQSTTGANEKFYQLMNQFDWKSQTNRSTQLVNEIQREYQCCGSFNGSESWEQLRPIDIPLGAYPLSCCPNEVNDNPSIQWCDEQHVRHRMSCGTASEGTVDKVANCVHIIIDITIETAIVQILCIICIFMLRSQPIDRSVPLI